MKSDNEFRRGLIDGIPIGLAYVAVSFAFGISGASKGIPVWALTLISATCVTSAGQFAAIITMTAGGSLVELVLSQIIINLRYSIMDQLDHWNSFRSDGQYIITIDLKECTWTCNLWNVDWDYHPTSQTR